MRGRIAVSLGALAAVLALLAGCGSAGGSSPGGESDAAQATGSPTAPPGGALVRFSKGQTAIVEIADSSEEQQRGLMGRTELEPDHGMLFVFASPSRIGFWMKDTLIPLSIAYMRRTSSGFKVLRIMEMTPCKRDPCRIYDPGTPYDATLEMARHWFKQHHVRRGATAVEELGAPATPGNTP